MKKYSLILMVLMIIGNNFEYLVIIYEASSMIARIFFLLYFLKIIKLRIRSFQTQYEKRKKLTDCWGDNGSRHMFILILLINSQF